MAHIVSDCSRIVHVLRGCLDADGSLCVTERALRQPLGREW